MGTKLKRKAPEMIVRNGQPRAVILDIELYEEILQRLEDLDDLRMLRNIRKKPLKFRKLEAFLRAQA